MQQQFDRECKEAQESCDRAFKELEDEQSDTQYRRFLKAQDAYDGIAAGCPWRLPKTDANGQTQYEQWCKAQPCRKFAAGICKRQDTCKHYDLSMGP